MRNKLKLSVAILVGLGLVATNLESNDQKKLNEQYMEEVQSGEYNENPQIDYMTNPMTGEKTEINKKELELSKVEKVDFYENEQDVFDMNSRDDIIYYVPMKAFRIETKGIQYTGLADGQGNFNTTDLLLKDGQNYVALINTRTDEILDIKESDLVFTYELDFELYWSDYMFEIEEEFLSGMINL